MVNPTPRSELVKAVSHARSIVAEAITGLDDASNLMRAAALPVILRELLDVEVTDDTVPGFTDL